MTIPDMISSCNGIFMDQNVHFQKARLKELPARSAVSKPARFVPCCLSQGVTVHSPFDHRFVRFRPLLRTPRYRCSHAACRASLARQHSTLEGFRRRIKFRSRHAMVSSVAPIARAARPVRLSAMRPGRHWGTLIVTLFFKQNLEFPGICGDL